MAHYGKAARLILVIVPVLAMAQAPQMKPAPQPRPAAPAAPGAAAPATATRPAAIPVIARPVVPQALRPAAAVAVPDLHVSQPAQLPPALMVTSANSSVKRDSSAGVDYAFGKLTVVADNAPLGLVLKLVAAKTGAVVDLAPELQNEPVMARLGPDSVRDVLTGLLDSPRIDYIVFGTGDEPGSLQRIVVRTRQSFGKMAMAAIHSPQPKQADPKEDERLDQNGQLITNGATPIGAQMTEQQRMENWQKVREEMRQAEIKRQAEDREREKTASPDAPAVQSNPEPENPPQGNPPQQ